MHIHVRTNTVTQGFCNSEFKELENITITDKRYQFMGQIRDHIPAT